MANASNNIAYVKSLYDEHDYTVPRVHVTNEVSISRDTPGIAGTIAVIGAFPNAETDIKIFTNYRSMLRYYNIDEGTNEEAAWGGLLACKYIFQYKNSGAGGAQEVLVCNITEEESAYLNEGYITLDYDDDDIFNVFDEDGNNIYVETVEDTGDDTSGTVTDTNDDGEEITYDTELTYRKLQQVLNRMYGEIFDLLFVADEMVDARSDYEYHRLDESEREQYKNNNGNLTSGEPTYVTRSGVVYKQVEVEYEIVTPYNIIDDFLQSEFQMQRPSQLIAPIRTSTRSASEVEKESGGIYNIAYTVDPDEIKAVCESFIDSVFSYGMLICQQIYVNGATDPLSLVNSAAYIVGYISSINVGTPLTFKTIPGVTDVTEVLEVGPGDTGYEITSYGAQVIVNKNRNDNSFCILNSTTPCGFDISQLRAVSYVIRQYDLQQFLGLPNTTTTHNKISAELASVNANMLSLIDILQSIDTSQMTVPVNESGTPYTHELYIAMYVVVNGILMLIDLGVNLEEAV